MERILQTHHFGPHRVDLVELNEDEGVAGYNVLVDEELVTDSPLPHEPSFEDLVRIYAASQHDS